MTKGREAERDVLDLLEALGYEVYLPPKAKYREQDVWGQFDLLAFGHSELLGVQVKGGRDAAGIRQWFEDSYVYAEHLEPFKRLFIHKVDDSLRVAAGRRESYEWVYDGRADGRPDVKALDDVLLD